MSGAVQVWFQNARAKYRRNTLKQEQQERSGGGGSTHQGDGAATSVDLHSAPAATPPAPRGQPRRGPSRSPASLSDLSSTPSTTNDAQSLAAPVGASAAGLLMMDLERRSAAAVHVESMFGSAAGFLVDNC